MKLIIDHNKCTGCRICESFCSFKKRGAVQPARANLRVKRQELAGIFEPLVCRHCAKPVCVEACPHEALIQQEDGVVRLVEENCLACGICAEACPFKVLFLDGEKGKPLKCDMCDGEPECAKMCSSGAITLPGQEDEKGA